MQLFPGTYCRTLPKSWEVGEVCKRREAPMQGKEQRHFQVDSSDNNGISLRQTQNANIGA